MISLNQSLTTPRCAEHRPIDSASLHRLVNGAKWQALRTLLATQEGQESIKAASSASSPTVFRFYGRNILHDLLSNEPPADIVFSMICILGQDFLTERDANDCGRNPFHSALANRRQPPNQEVIDTILAIYPDIAAISDDNKVTPLMIECSMGKRCRSKTVKALVNAAPQQVTEEDKDGTTALEYALMSGATSVFRALQRYQAIELRKRSEDEQLERLKTEDHISRYIGQQPMVSILESMESIELTVDTAMPRRSRNIRQTTRTPRAA